MKVLCVSYWSFSNSYYTAKYCNAIASNDSDVYILVPSNFETKLLSKDVSYKKLNFIAPMKMDFSDLKYIPLQFIQTLKYIKKLEPDIIHFLWSHPVVILLLPFLKKYNIAFTVHDPLLHAGESSFVAEFIQKQIIKKSNLLFIHGEKNKLILERKYRLEDQLVESINHGELGFWTPQKKKFNKTALFFGRIREYKGLNILVEAFLLALKEDPDINLIICGEGEIGSLKKVINGESKIKLVNRYIEHDEIESYFSKADFLVLPYTNATQSGVIPMAFSLRKTCIATDVGGISDMIEDNVNGLLIKPNDANALKKSILRLCSSSELCFKLSENAYKRSKENGVMSWNVTKDIALKAYNKIRLKSKIK